MATTAVSPGSSRFMIAASMPKVPGPGSGMQACSGPRNRRDSPPRPTPQDETLAMKLAKALVPICAVLALAACKKPPEKETEAARALEARARPPGSDLEGVLLLAELYRRTRRWEDGIALLERHLPALGDAERARAEEALGRLRKDRDRWQTFLSSL